MARNSRTASSYRFCAAPICSRSACRACRAAYHATGLSIKEHYTDTGGASDHVFGLMPFFGYRFAPRLRDLKERRLHLLPGQDAGPLLAGMTGDPVSRSAMSPRIGTNCCVSPHRSAAALPRHRRCYADYLRRDNQGENSATMKMRKAAVCLSGRGA